MTHGSLVIGRGTYTAVGTVIKSQSSPDCFDMPTTWYAFGENNLRPRVLVFEILRE